MKRNHLILILCLCIVVAALGAGYVIFGGKDDDSSSDSEKSVSDENDTDDMFDENINDIFLFLVFQAIISIPRVKGQVFSCIHTNEFLFLLFEDDLLQEHFF
jgi:hypothetical protein